LYCSVAAIFVFLELVSLDRNKVAAFQDGHQFVGKDDIGGAVLVVAVCADWLALVADADACVADVLASPALVVAV
jgi:hypothetical protein